MKIAPPTNIVDDTRPPSFGAALINRDTQLVLPVADGDKEASTKHLADALRRHTAPPDTDSRLDDLSYQVDALSRQIAAMSKDIETRTLQAILDLKP